jgi:hypothetical protein
LSKSTGADVGDNVDYPHRNRTLLFTLLAGGLFQIQIPSIYFVKFKKIFSTFVRLFLMGYTTDGKALDKIIG